jgi:hypothetical protein
VLLVHGIGDHQEGETLTAFGEPLIDWLRQWLRGTLDDGDRFTAVTEARLKAVRSEGESPAYAMVTVTGRGDDRIATETWLLAEAWWGDSVQPPVALKLLGWLWSRAPLLIYWHFYLLDRARREPGDDRSNLDMRPAVAAFLLAASSQFVIAIAMLLWLVPIGKWRQAVARAVRALTLTLGDSYVLLEHDIQRGALVDRVRKSLQWLAERSTAMVVIAHSQGGAIAHEALARSHPPRMRAFLSVGSGLEKLQFLQMVRQHRSGLVLASVLAPYLLASGALLVHGFLSPNGERWEIGVGLVSLFVALIVSAFLVLALDRYRQRLLADVDRLRLVSDDERFEWTDISNSHDVVPMGKGSLLSRQGFVTRATTTDERSFFFDHVSYFRNNSSSLALLWQALAKASGLRLFTDEQQAALRRFDRLHRWHAKVLAWTRWSTYIAILTGLVLLPVQLLQFGQSIVAAVAGSPMGDLLKPISAVAGGLVWLMQLVRAPGTPVTDVLTHALVGDGILVASIAVWALVFRGLWRVGAAKRWRSACRGADVLHTKTKRGRSVAACGAYFVLGSLPLIVIVILVTAPQLLSVTTIGQALSNVLSLAFFCYGLVFAIVGPWVWNPDEAEHRRRPTGEALWIPLTGLLFIGFTTWAGWALWTTDLPVELIAFALLLINAASWQVYIVAKLRTRLGVMRTALLTVVPLVALAALTASGRLDLGSAGLLYLIVGPMSGACAGAIAYPQNVWFSVAVLRESAGHLFRRVLDNRLLRPLKRALATRRVSPP